MSESREHKTRYNQKLQYIAAFEKWLSNEPPLFRFIKWYRWARIERPRREDYIGC